MKLSGLKEVKVSVNFDLLRGETILTWTPTGSAVTLSRCECVWKPPALVG